MLNDTRERTLWLDLPVAVRDAVERETGTVQAVDPVRSGLNAGFTAIVHASSTSVFVKGMPTEHRRIATQQREAAVADRIAGIGPVLRWQFEAGGWNILGFDHLRGHHADLGPGSADLGKLADVLTRLGQLPAPGLPLARIERRWAGYADQRELAVLAGDRLLHTDLNPHNILITTSGAKIVDWAWPTLGAAWVDPACAALWLIAEGHSPAAAENWAAAIPAWREAPATGIDVFTTVNRNLWEQIADNDPQPWKDKLHQAAQAWNEYRLRLHRSDS
ncbi:hypothetical protein AMK34_13065 [Amycolatopsis sp. CB00013]|nr:hypothetical protein AMK34_13065 [Amycolatopsis sp. CB00013]